ncbi:hypothetical protein F9K96_05545 [Brucella anthropi]|uniref:hypothetical protein n=1 Tax=Brucella anthropi TaxID=529 RepID=UPI00124D8C4D|nr:hypothetical protein [Brucella anthropi]KAB2792602.1 hypothetical protein F9K96_05545 [Brucella anthropi]
MKISVVCASALIAFVTNAYSATVLDGSFPKEAPISFEQMHKAVSKEFTDPSSSQYKGITIHEQPGRGPSFCGWVNSKNAFGGYTKFYPFGMLVDVDEGEINPSFDDPILFDLSELAFARYGCRQKLGYPKPE